jgi:hypothetical protein
MLRRCFAGLSVAILAAASLQAPFAHFHPEDPQHHHARGFAHTHLLPHDHESREREWESHPADETTIYLDWLPAAAQRLVVAYTQVPVTFAWQPAFVRLSVMPDLEPQAHSPPHPRLLPARAPPV